MVPTTWLGFWFSMDSFIYHVWFLDHHPEGQLDAERLGGVGGAGDVGGAHLIYIYICIMFNTHIYIYIYIHI